MTDLQIPHAVHCGVMEHSTLRCTFGVGGAITIDPGDLSSGPVPFHDEAPFGD